MARRVVEGRMRRHEEGNGSRGSQGSLSAHQSAAGVAGGRGNRRRGGAARTPRRLEVGDGVEDWFANCKKSSGLTEN